MLSDSERKALAHFHGTEVHKILRKLIDIERIELAKDHVGQREILEVVDLTGQTKALKRLIGTIDENYKKFKKKEQKS